MKKGERKKVITPTNKFDIIQSILDEDNAEQIEEDPITIESIRACKGYENLSEEEVVNMVHTLKTLAEIMITNYIKHNLQKNTH